MIKNNSTFQYAIDDKVASRIPENRNVFHAGIELAKVTEKGYLLKFAIQNHGQRFIAKKVSSEVYSQQLEKKTGN